MNLLELKDISKVYGNLKALQDINLSVKQGEWLAIMGPSGSGKTTMMNIIGCMDKPSGGTVFLDGLNISKESDRNLTTARRDKIGLIFQQFHLVNYLTALENVMVAQYYHSLPDEKEAMEALDRVGLAGRAKHLPSQLSGGEQQRVCIARALINYPKLILADEPTGNLDEANENIVIDIFRKLHAEGSTIIVVTHDPEVAEDAERTVVLEHGRIARIVKNGEEGTQQMKSQETGGNV
jgi:putative ABC transport system ATP-binding protein